MTEPGPFYNVTIKNNGQTVEFLNVTAAEIPEILQRWMESGGHIANIRRSN